MMIRDLNGKTPQIHKTAFVSESAYVVGDVVIGARSSVWPGAVIRGDMGKVTIGENTNIQDGAIVHCYGDTTIGNGVVIGHCVVWHGKELGDRCLLGNSSTVNERVVVGSDSIIASGSVVLDDVTIPSRSMVLGIPGKVVRETTDKHADMVSMTVKLYSQNAELYRKSGL
jgi:carbonic anhydrase/acetyltransferase-like protein (isoleucine patch superfamily)